MMTDMIESAAMIDRQREFARQMRAEPTDAERVLWLPIMLPAIEFDDELCQASDALRTHRIESAGYRVLRFWNHDVLGNLEGVLSEIQRTLPPTPDPSPQGGGEPRQRAKRAPRLSRKERH